MKRYKLTQVSYRHETTADAMLIAFPMGSNMMQIVEAIQKNFISRSIDDVVAIEILGDVHLLDNGEILAKDSRGVRSSITPLGKKEDKR